MIISDCRSLLKIVQVAVSGLGTGIAGGYFVLNGASILIFDTSIGEGIDKLIK